MRVIQKLCIFLLSLCSLLDGTLAEPRVVCYYTNWSVYRPGTAKFNPQNINPYLCTHLIYAFGGFTKDNKLKPFDKYQDIEQGGYAKFTGLKTYNKNLKTMLAIGGWNEGSARFSPLVASSERRGQLVKNSIKFLRQNKFDGLDLDWEYPAFRDGGKSKDRENYAKFVQELREEFDREHDKTGRPRLLLTMAVPAGLEYIDKGYDVPKLNKYLDWFNLLSYDYHSAYEPSVDHHAPLYPIEEENEYSFNTDLNINATINYYLKSGADRDKLVLGIPTYGRSYTLFNSESSEIGAPADGPGEQGDATREKGYLAYYEICQNLKEEDSDWEVVQPNPDALGPYAVSGNQWVGYDDEAIVRKKSEFVVEHKLGGIMFWSIDNDDFRGLCNGKAYPLIEAAKDAYLNSLATGVQSKSSFDSNKRKPVKSSTTTRKPDSNRNQKSTTPQPPTTPDPGSDFKCEDEGFFPHPRDCKKYFWCLDSGASGLGIVAHQFTCPAGLFFNKAADSCDYSRNVLCSKTTTETPTTSPATTTVSSSTQRVSLATKLNTFYKSPSRQTTPRFTTVAYEEEPITEHSTFDQEDPKVIKELIGLIKKAGGIEELEKQLHLNDDESDSVSTSNTGQKSSTSSTINKNLYQKVLDRASVFKARPNFNGPSHVLTEKYTTKQQAASTTTESSTTLKYKSISRNRPAGPQNAGVEQLAETEGLLLEKPKYTTITRRPVLKPEVSMNDYNGDPESSNESEESKASVSTKNQSGSRYTSINRKQKPVNVDIDEDEPIRATTIEPEVSKKPTKSYFSLSRRRATTEAVELPSSTEEPETTTIKRRILQTSSPKTVLRTNNNRNNIESIIQENTKSTNTDTQAKQETFKNTLDNDNTDYNILSSPTEPVTDKEPYPDPTTTSSPSSSTVSQSIQVTELVESETESYNQATIENNVDQNTFESNTENNVLNSVENNGISKQNDNEILVNIESPRPFSRAHTRPTQVSSTEFIERNTASAETLAETTQRKLFPSRARPTQFTRTNSIERNTASAETLAETTQGKIVPSRARPTQFARTDSIERNTASAETLIETTQGKIVPSRARPTQFARTDSIERNTASAETFAEPTQRKIVPSRTRPTQVARTDFIERNTASAKTTQRRILPSRITSQFTTPIEEFVTNRPTYSYRPGFRGTARFRTQSTSSGQYDKDSNYLLNNIQRFQDNNRLRALNINRLEQSGDGDDTLSTTQRAFKQSSTSRSSTTAQTRLEPSTTQRQRFNAFKTRTTTEAETGIDELEDQKLFETTATTSQSSTTQRKRINAFKTKTTTEAETGTDELEDQKFFETSATTSQPSTTQRKRINAFKARTTTEAETGIAELEDQKLFETTAKTTQSFTTQRKRINAFKTRTTIEAKTGTDELEDQKLFETSATTSQPSTIQRKRINAFKARTTTEAETGIEELEDRKVFEPTATTSQPPATQQKRKYILKTGASTQAVEDAVEETTEQRVIEPSNYINLTSADGRPANLRFTLTAGRKIDFGASLAKKNEIKSSFQENAAVQQEDDSATISSRKLQAGHVEEIPLVLQTIPSTESVTVTSFSDKLHLSEIPLEKADIESFVSNNDLKTTQIDELTTRRIRLKPSKTGFRLETSTQSDSDDYTEINTVDSLLLADDKENETDYTTQQTNVQHSEEKEGTTSVPVIESSSARSKIFAGRRKPESKGFTARQSSTLTTESDNQSSTTEAVTREAISRTRFAPRRVLGGNRQQTQNDITQGRASVEDNQVSETTEKIYSLLPETNSETTSSTQVTDSSSTRQRFKIYRTRTTTTRTTEIESESSSTSESTTTDTDDSRKNNNRRKKVIRRPVTQATEEPNVKIDSESQQSIVETSESDSVIEVKRPLLVRKRIATKIYGKQQQKTSEPSSETPELEIASESSTQAPRKRFKIISKTKKNRNEHADNSQINEDEDEIQNFAQATYGDQNQQQELPNDIEGNNDAESNADQDIEIKNKEPSSSVVPTRPSYRLSTRTQQSVQHPEEEEDTTLIIPNLESSTYRSRIFTQRRRPSSKGFTARQISTLTTETDNQSSTAEGAVREVISRTRPTGKFSPRRALNANRQRTQNNLTQEPAIDKDSIISGTTENVSSFLPDTNEAINEETSSTQATDNGSTRKRFKVYRTRTTTTRTTDIENESSSASESTTTETNGSRKNGSTRTRIIKRPVTQAPEEPILNPEAVNDSESQQSIVETSESDSVIEVKLPSLERKRITTKIYSKQQQQISEPSSETPELETADESSVQVPNKRFKIISKTKKNRIDLGKKLNFPDNAEIQESEDEIQSLEQVSNANQNQQQSSTDGIEIHNEEESNEDQNIEIENNKQRSSSVVPTRPSYRLSTKARQIVAIRKQGQNFNGNNFRLSTVHPASAKYATEETIFSNGKRVTNRRRFKPTVSGSISTDDIEGEQKSKTTKKIFSTFRKQSSTTLAPNITPFTSDTEPVTEYEDAVDTTEIPDDNNYDILQKTPETSKIPKISLSRFTTTPKPTTLTHVFAIDEDELLEIQKNKNKTEITENNADEVIRKLQKLIEINRVVEVYSKEEKLKLLKNKKLKSIKHSELTLERPVTVDRYSEISRQTIIKLVKQQNATQNASTENPISTDARSPKNILFSETIFGQLESSTISLEGLFEREKKSHDSDDFETTEASEIDTTIEPVKLINSISHIRAPAPFLRPESNETDPIAIISIANLDKVILSKIQRNNKSSEDIETTTLIDDSDASSN